MKKDRRKPEHRGFRQGERKRDRCGLCKECGYRPSQSTTHLEAKKKSPMEVCPRCATPSTSTYDHRTVRLKDAPLRDKAVVLSVHTRRFSCKPCGRPFTEPVPGVRKGCRSTERYKRSVLWACENFSDLKSVRSA
jgi:transposase